jgi:hypothetical protein
MKLGDLARFAEIGAERHTLALTDARICAGARPGLKKVSSAAKLPA